MPQDQLIKEAVEFLQMTKTQAKKIDQTTLHDLVKSEKRKWLKTINGSLQPTMPSGLQSHQTVQL